MATIIWFVCPQPVLAMEYFIKTGPDMDSLRFSFDSKQLNPKVRRTGKQQITLSFPPGSLRKEKAPTPMPLASMRILNSIKIGSSNIVINTKTNGFGYIRIPAGNGELKIQFFRDPFGAKWQAPKKKTAKRTVKNKISKARKKTLPTPEQPKKTSRVGGDKAVTRSNALKFPERQLSETDIAPDSAAGTNSQSEISRKPESAVKTDVPQTNSVRPFYSVPYTYRAPVSKVGPGEAKAVNTTVAPSSLSEGTVSGPSAGGKISGPSAGGTISGPSAEGTVSGPSAGGTISGPSAEGTVSGPSAGGTISGPSAGGAVSGPSVGGAVSGPSAEGTISGPSAGGTISGPSAGGTISGPSAGGTISGPSAEGTISGPSAEGTISGPNAEGTISPPSQKLPVKVSSNSGVVGAVVPPASTAESRDKENSGAVVGSVLPPEAEQPGNSTPVLNATNSSGTGENFPISGTDSGKPQTSSDAYPVTEAEDPTDVNGTRTPTLEERITTAKGLLLAADSSLESGELEAALGGYTGVASMTDIPKALRLRALYGKAETITEVSKGDLAGNFNKVTKAWMEAMNADTNSPDVPSALLNLGLANLKVGNMPEAKAYFNLLKSQYPNDLNIPYISYYWGQYYLDKGENTKAADQFQHLVQRYPDSKVVREAALGLSKALNALGYYDQSSQILDYIDKRWPRFYIEYPEFLLLSANTENTLGNLDPAKEHYWAYYNLLPESKQNDIVLARLGDIYLRKGDKRAAKEIYEKAIKDYPDKEGGLVSKMRLAEEGIYDDPNMAQMNKVFDRPYNLRPEKVYTSIVDDHPKSRLAPLALLKLAMWNYWNKKYGDCLSAVSDFVSKYPRSSLLPKARELGFKVFDRAVPELVKDENYGKVINFWNTYGRSNNKGEGINDDTRLGVALSFWKKGRPKDALELIDRYLKKKQIPKYSTMALDMALGINVEDQSWSNVTALVDMVKKNWKIDQRQQAQIDYAAAMAYENLGETERSTPVWAGLASNLLLPPSSRAYAMYYMAKSAMKKKDLKKLFVYSQEALSMLLETGGDREKIKDSILMTIYSAESSGRYREALKWAAEYDKYIPDSDSEWASSRFRLAQLYEKAGANTEWRKLMAEVAKKRPGSLYGRLATSALESHRIENEASQFQSNRGF